ncbi:MAG TPA: VirB3 family type IV secretion system protein [Longimicrobium sp.]|jgi:type IV secretory pathway VirB3-like protein
MNLEELDRDLVHPSLTRPVLWAGVERRVVGVEFMVLVLLVTWKGITLGSVVLGAFIVLPIHLVARYAAGVDPRMTDLFVRSLAWRRYYPPHAGIHAAPQAVRPSIPGAK